MVKNERYQLKKLLKIRLNKFIRIGWNKGRKNMEKMIEQMDEKLLKKLFKSWRKMGKRGIQIISERKMEKEL